MEPVRLLVDPAKAVSAWSDTTYSGSLQIEPIRRPKPGPRGPRGPRATGSLSYAPGLDGMRALAVAAVVVYHLDNTWLSGGFLGVDIFFVLSGFLITSILLTEFGNTGRIDIKGFYLRRARRLLPALYAMLVGVVLFTAVTASDELHRLRGDVLAALGYCTNWTQILWNRSYFDQLDRPSLLQHLWSLAVEEQFYLIWPLLLVVYLVSRHRWATLAFTVGLIIASTMWMALLYEPGTDPKRVYYGSDTHIAPMLVGAALAIVLVLRRDRGRPDAAASSRIWVDAAALVGLVGLAWATVNVTYYSDGLYRGGYLLISLAALAVLLAAASPGTLTARVFSLRPLVWIGQRSYAIYLWHWPILTLTRPGVDVTLARPVLVVLQVGATLVLADLSYRFLERPIRKIGLVAFMRGNRRHGTRAIRQRRARLSAMTATTVAVSVVLLATASASSGGIQVDKTNRQVTVHIADPTASVPPAPSGDGSPSGNHAPAAPPPFARPVRVSFFGDSQGMTLLINKPKGLDGQLRTSDSTVEGCGVLLGTIRSTVGFSRNLDADCGSWPQQWRDNAAQNKPQIAVVELGAWDVFNDTVDGTTLEFGTKAWDAYYTRQLAKGIAILLDAGAQVALMGVPCYRPIAAGGLPLLPERGLDDRTRHVTSLLKEAVAKNPQRVFFVHPPTQFCHAPISTDVNYRWDGTHFYIPGAALMFEVITPQLLRIPQPPAR